jgi:hypothetical protein
VNYRRLWALLVVAIAGCGSGAATPSSPATLQTAPAGTPGLPSAGVTNVASTPTPGPTATVIIGKPYASFVASLCTAFRRPDVNTLISSLAYYQYNSGLRYGNFGDGAGQTGDPSLLRNWMQGSHVRCTQISPGQDGHGTLLTRGWKKGAWSLIELDIFDGKWKINDFTFGDRRTLIHAMQVDRPIIAYRAVK